VSGVSAAAKDKRPMSVSKRSNGGKRMTVFRRNTPSAQPTNDLESDSTLALIPAFSPEEKENRSPPHRMF